MIVDLRSCSHPAEVDLCIVGGGAAGIALAREFVGTKINVAMLESGGNDFNAEIQALYDGESIGEPYYQRLDQCRTRRFGGSTNCWGGMCTPMTEIDFRKRAWVPYSGWPITNHDMQTYLKRAHKLCGIGPYAYDEDTWKVLGASAIPFDPDKLWSHFWQINNRHGDRQVRFAAKFRTELEQAKNIGVYLHANVTRLNLNHQGERVESLRIETLEGRTSTIKAKLFVLACGGIENVRLLLVSDQQRTAGIGNDYDVVGRYFNEHLQAPCATVKLNPKNVRFCDYSRLWPLGRSHALPGLTLSPRAQEKHQTLNASLSADPVFNADHAWTVIKNVRHDLAQRKLSVSALKNVIRMLRGSRVLVPDVYRRMVHGGRPTGDPTEYTLYARAEQAPNPASRIRLTAEVDRLGMRKLALDWHTTELDRRAFPVLVDAARTEFERLGLGVVQEHAWVREQAWPNTLAGGPHHMGTTRMSDDPRYGVVDRNAKVHGVQSLYIAGSSVFPTGGHANCTLTLLATTLRLAERLKKELARIVPSRAHVPAVLVPDLLLATQGNAPVRWTPGAGGR